MINRVKKWYYKKVSKPSGATIEGWQDWKELVSNNHPVLYFMFETMPRYVKRIPRSFRDKKYHLTQKYTRKGYHLLELDVKRFKQPYNRNRLGKYSWMDADTQLELFSFQILVNYIEKEENYEAIKANYDSGDVKWELMEAVDLYHWFINEYCDDTEYLLEKWELYSRYPNYKKYKLNLFEKPKSDDEKAFTQERRALYRINHDLEEIMRKEMTINLQRLAKIRGSLWT